MNQNQNQNVIAVINQDKTRQDNALFGVLYSPMYIYFLTK